MDPMGWASGKYDSRNTENLKCLSNPPSRFERETLHTMNGLARCEKSIAFSERFW